jgi:hypothetical protein
MNSPNLFALGGASRSPGRSQGWGVIDMTDNTIIEMIELEHEIRKNAADLIQGAAVLRKAGKTPNKDIEEFETRGADLLNKADELCRLISQMEPQTPAEAIALAEFEYEKKCLAEAAITR